MTAATTAFSNRVRVDGAVIEGISGGVSIGLSDGIDSFEVVPPSQESLSSSLIRFL